MYKILFCLMPLFACFSGNDDCSLPCDAPRPVLVTDDIAKVTDDVARVTDFRM